MRLGELLDQPGLPGWWDWPPDSEPSTVEPSPATGEAPGSASPIRLPSQTTQSRRTRRRLVPAVAAAALVAVGLVTIMAFALRPAPRRVAVEEDATTPAAQFSRGADQLNGGPTVTIGSLSCNHPVQVPPGATIEETQGTLGATTFTDPVRTCGAGPKVGADLTVDVACRLLAPEMSSVNPDGYWYLIATGPNRGRFAAANTFLNGDAPGAGNLTNTDVAVPRCVVR